MINPGSKLPHYSTIHPSLKLYTLLSDIFQLHPPPLLELPGCGQVNLLMNLLVTVCCQ